MFFKEMFEVAMTDELSKERERVGDALFEVLWDIEFLEGGSVEIDDGAKEVWISADNGREEVSSLMESLLSFD